MNLTGWIIYNGSLQSDKFLDFANMLHKAAIKKLHSAKIVKNNELLSLLHSDFSLLQKLDNELPDYVIFTDKDIYLANQLELLGIRTFNSAGAIAISDDKIATYQRLTQNRLPIPKTIVAPKVFGTIAIAEAIDLTSVVDMLGLPLIVKEAFGSFGEQVYLIETMEQLQKKVNELAGKPFMFQEFISTSYGRDLRLHVVGKQVVAAMKRTSKHDFRANITAGGTMESYHPSALENELAIAASKAIGADFAGVDILFGTENQPIICEVNSNAHIRNMYDCTNINVADYIIDYICNNI